MILRHLFPCILNAQSLRPLGATVHDRVASKIFSDTQAQAATPGEAILIIGHRRFAVRYNEVPDTQERSMYEPSKFNPTSRFSGLSHLYSKGRPGYPEQALDFIVDYARLVPGSVLADIGCGTGISSRLFARRGLEVVGVEPNADMLNRALEENAGSSLPIRYVCAAAESTGLQPGSCRAVLCAQSFHWFDPERALSEFLRILEEAGSVVLMWNERDETDEFTAGYGALMRRRAEATTAIEMERGRSGECLLHDDRFTNSNLAYFANSQQLDRDGLFARAFSTSYAPGAGTESGAALAADLQKLFELHSTSDTVQLVYRCSVYCARKRQ